MKTRKIVKDTECKIYNYFFECCKRKCDGKELTQKERVFLALYEVGDTGLPRNFFFRKMKPVIINIPEEIKRL